MTGKRLGMNKGVSLVSATTVRTRLSMSFPDPLNPRTYFYKAVLAACARLWQRAHVCALRSLGFFKLWLDSVSNSFLLFSSPLHRLQIKSLVERENQLASALHPSPSIFPCGFAPRPASGFLPQAVLETRTWPSGSPARARLPTARVGTAGC